MKLLQTIGLTHKDIENQGTENFNNVVKSQIDKLMKKGDILMCLKILTNLWIVYLTRIYLTAKEIQRSSNKSDSIKLYFSNCCWKKKKAPLVKITGFKMNNVSKILRMLHPYIGKPDLISNPDN